MKYLSLENSDFLDIAYFAKILKFPGDRLELLPSVFLNKTDRARVDEKKIEKTEKEKNPPNPACCNSICLCQA